MVYWGISSGQPISVGIALKPTSSIQVPGQSIDIDGNTADVITTGADPCVGLRAVPAEAMLALVLMDHALRHRGQNADVVSPACYLVASHAQATIHQALRSDLRGASDLGTHRGAVDIVGVSAEALWEYVWLSIQGVLLVIAISAPFAVLLYFIKRP